jgi:NADH-quinone oxidoreductase subunit C
VPDATGLELIAHELRDADADSIIGTHFQYNRATLLANPATTHDVVERLMHRGYTFIASLHGVDYYPEEPRLGVLYELLDMTNVDRITVKARVSTDASHMTCAGS